MHIRRRPLITGGLALPAAPGMVAAQPVNGVWRVGLMPAGLMAPRHFQWDALRLRMGELGYVEGRNVKYEVRAPKEEGGPFDELAAGEAGAGGAAK